MTRSAALVLATAALASGAVAEPLDRLAVERLGSETPRDAALAFERACWRAAVDVASADPVQELAFAGASFVRLLVEGPPETVRCLDALEPGRRGIDGTYQWFDRVEGGLVLPSADEPQRVPLDVLIDPARALPAAAPDPARVTALQAGDRDAFEMLLKAPVDESLALVRSLVAAGSPITEAQLERIAAEHPSWRVRREAVLALDVSLALSKVLALVRDDPSWEVRHAGVLRVGDVAPGALITGGTERSKEISGALADRISTDAAWEVRREALWQLPTAYVGDLESVLRTALLKDAEPRVRAVALETLAGAGKVEADELRELLAGNDPSLRAVAASMLARAPGADDLRPLWAAMRDADRLVRIAAAGLLEHIDDATIGPQLWSLYVDEVSALDADARYLAVLLDALARQPFDGLAAVLETRLASPLDPDERRLVARAFGRVAPERSLLLFRKLLQSKDPLARSISADAAPDAPDVRDRRLALLEDDDADVRAGAVLGLCRTPGALPPERAQGVSLEPVGLGAVALAASARCGAAPVLSTRQRTSLGAPAGETPSEQNAAWPAIAALVLLVASVLGIKLAQPRTA